MITIFLAYYVEEKHLESGHVNIIEELDYENFVIYSPIKDENKINDNDRKLIEG